MEERGGVDVVLVAGRGGAAAPEASPMVWGWTTTSSSGSPMNPAMVTTAISV